MQAVLLAQRTKQVSAHASVPMVCPIENLRLDQWLYYCLGKTLPESVGVLAEIGMMNEAFAAGFQFRSQFVQVCLYDIAVRMNQRIEAENKIDRTVRNHRQRAAVVYAAVHVRRSREALTTCFNAFSRLINGPKFFAVILQIMRPPSEPGCNFQNRGRRQEIANAGKNGAGPLCGRSAPRRRPFLARLSPIVLHRMTRTDASH